VLERLDSANWESESTSYFRVVEADQVLENDDGALFGCQLPKGRLSLFRQYGLLGRLLHAGRSHWNILPKLPMVAVCEAAAFIDNKIARNAKEPAFQVPPRPTSCVEVFQQALKDLCGEIFRCFGVTYVMTDVSIQWCVVFIKDGSQSALFQGAGTREQACIRVQDDAPDSCPPYIGRMT
jgi:hypothetical protein